MLKTMFTKSRLINSVAFNVAWFGCVLLGNNIGFLVLLWALIHFIYSNTFKSEFVFVTLMTLIGFLIDTGLLHLSVLIFPDNTNIIPFWLTMIWLAFALTLNGYLTPLQHSPLLQCIVGGIFPPLSYLAGASFGAVEFGYSIMQTLLILGVLWAGLLPTFFYINNLIKGALTYAHTNTIH